MDEVQAAFYRMKFHVAFLEKKGAEFQDWFAKLAARAFGPDFEAVRPYGNQGDLKCDGRQVSTGTIFQCYAPYQMKQAELNAKMDRDFRGAYENWRGDMTRWCWFTMIRADCRRHPFSDSMASGGTIRRCGSRSGRKRSCRSWPTACLWQISRRSLVLHRRRADWRR